MAKEDKEAPRASKRRKKRAAAAPVPAGPAQATAPRAAMAPQPYPDVFGESRYYITSEHMKAFRARLFSEARSRDTAAYHPTDRRRIQDSDEYCWRFIVHNRLDLERAVRMADAALKWRAQARLHELSESSLPRACLQAGFVHPFNVDRYGNHVLLLRPGQVRDLPLADVRRVLVFFVETLLRRQNASRITLLVDCAGGGDRHQLELGRYLMALFRCYYPRSLGFVLLWEPPRLLQGLWKLCKGLMPVEALERIRFVTVRDIGRYVDRDKLPVRMGGTDNYRYVYTPGKPLGERCPRLAPLDPVSCPTASLHVYGMFTA